MKTILVTFMLLITINIKAKSIQKIIYQNDLIALKKYINKRKVLDEIITMEDGEELHILEYSAYFHRLDCLKLIVASKTKINNFKKLVSRAFVYAICTRHSDETLDYLFSLDPDLSITVSELDNKDALMFSIINYDAEWYFKLISKSNPLHIDRFGKNNFHYLAEYGFEESIFMDLIKYPELDINKVDVFNETPLNLIFSTSNILLREIFIENKAIFFDDKSAYRDAVISGDDYFFDYVVEKIDTMFNWSLLSTYDIDSKNEYYALEYVISYNSRYIGEIILNQMFDDVVNAKGQEQQNKLGILYSILSDRYLKDGDRYRAIYTSLFLQNRNLFVLLVEGMGRFNRMNLECTHSNNKKRTKITEVTKLTYHKIEYEKATNIYGKQFVDSLNRANQIIIK